jgi:hypothetical protein
VILYIIHNYEHISLSYIGLCELYMSLLWIFNNSIWKPLEFFMWRSYTKITWLRNFLNVCSYFMIFSHLFLSNEINNYSNIKTWSENSIDSHNNIFWLHNNLTKVANYFNKAILYIFHSCEHISLSNIVLREPDMLLWGILNNSLSKSFKFFMRRS